MNFLLILFNALNASVFLIESSQLTGFYMRATLAFNGLNKRKRMIFNFKTQLEIEFLALCHVDYIRVKNGYNAKVIDHELELNKFPILISFS